MRKQEPPITSGLGLFHPAVRNWFEAVFSAPTRPQILGWAPIARGESTLLCAPTGSGKTLAAFLWCLDRLMFTAPPAPAQRCRVLYISPIKALAVDVERNLRAPLIGIANSAKQTRRRSPRTGHRDPHGRHQHRPSVPDSRGIPPIF